GNHRGMTEHLTGPDFKMAFYQATVFTPDTKAPLPALLRDLITTWTRFDQEPLVLPREMLPTDAPYLVLHEGKGQWRCEIAVSRANLFWRPTEEGASEPTLEAFFQEASSYLVQYVGFTTTTINRVAAVVSRYARIPTPGVFLARHF